MCGITGILSFDDRPAAPRRLRAMNDSLTHRGPHDVGCRVDGGVGLAMCRAGDHRPRDRPPADRQRGRDRPSRLQREDYNFRELRRRLEARGHRFRHRHRHRGHRPPLRGARAPPASRSSAGCSPSPCGMRTNWRLLLARDRIGIKPLDWARHRGPFGDELLFGSEVKAILAAGSPPATVDGGGPRAPAHLRHDPRRPEHRRRDREARAGPPAPRISGRRRSSRRYWDLRFEPDRGRAIRSSSGSRRSAVSSTQSGPPPPGERRPPGRSVAPWLSTSR